MQATFCCDAHIPHWRCFGQWAQVSMGTLTSLRLHSLIRIKLWFSVCLTHLKCKTSQLNYCTDSISLPLHPFIPVKFGHPRQFCQLTNFSMNHFLVGTNYCIVSANHKLLLFLEMLWTNRAMEIWLMSKSFRSLQLSLLPASNILTCSNKTDWSVAANDKILLVPL